MYEFDFKKYLEVNTKNYDGPHKEAVISVVHLYTFLENVLQDDDTSYSLRNDIYVTFGYLFYPHDLFSEDEHGPIGFIDDIMLMLFVINKIQQNHGSDFIRRHWVATISPQTLLVDKFDILKTEYEDLFIDVLRNTGFVDESF